MFVLVRYIDSDPLKFNIVYDGSVIPTRSVVFKTRADAEAGLAIRRSIFPREQSVVAELLLS